jgi:predicted lactoylglutathione lyase
MATKIFVNLPVENLGKSIQFFKGLGYTFNQQFTDNSAACMVISNDIYAMLLTYDKFNQFTYKNIVDAKKSTEVLVCLSAETRNNVDELLEKALNGGASEYRDPQDYGFMYGRSFEDPDGHIWEIMWMDPSAIKS